MDPTVPPAQTAPSVQALPSGQPARPAPAPQVARAWRAGKTLVILQGTQFPCRCVKCNEPAEAPIAPRTVYWHPPAWYLLILAGVLIYAVVALVIRKKATVLPGLCARHRRRRWGWIAAGWLGPVAGIAIMAAGGGAAVAAGVLVALVSVVLAMSQAQVVTARRIDDWYVHLDGCGEPFLAGLPPLPAQARR